MKIKAVPNDIKKLGLVTGHQIQVKLGVSQPTLSRWAQNGEIRRLSHGLYIHPDFEIPPQELDFAVACKKFGSQSAIGGLSALFQYRLIDQVPAQIWIVVPPSKADSNPLYRTLRTRTSIKHGIENFKFYRMTSLERTLIETLKFAFKVGPRIAINATRKALKEGLTTEKRLVDMAKKLKLQSILEKYWESVVE